MAQKVLVQLVDDLDGSSSDEVSTVTFGLDGVEYEIDLGATNAENLRKEFEAYIAVGRRTGGRRRRTTSTTTGSSEPGEAALIREWALGKGYELSARGRIPGKVVEEYHEEKAAAEDKPPTARRKSRKKS
jgi:hypothetical protein